MHVGGSKIKQTEGQTFSVKQHHEYQLAVKIVKEREQQRIDWGNIGLVVCGPAARATRATWATRVRHEYEYCDVCVTRSDGNTLDDCFQVRNDSPEIPQPLQNRAPKGDRQLCQSS